MVALCILETSVYLFFSVLTDYVRNHLDIVSFFEILGCVLVIDVMRKLIEILLEGNITIQESKMIVKRAEEKCEITGVPTVHSLMIYKMCQGLDLPVKLAAEPDRKLWVAKRMSLNKEKRPIPKVFSKTILMFCEALDIDAELSHLTLREQHLLENQLKRRKPLPVVHSITIFKMCKALGLSAKLDA
ncbi:hypothetical protein TNCT_149311 [Trichonephila clavata]|uniref:Uncharacterized protein n=1 Tax=Trichonephila clavata TaxID=2740835 RepID=A0A8X6KW92_TRICU|nr:hypothetical protein TNCT_149311 [Trichonephila clavata]